MGWAFVLALCFLFLFLFLRVRYSSCLLGRTVYLCFRGCTQKGCLFIFVGYVANELLFGGFVVVSFGVGRWLWVTRALGVWVCCGFVGGLGGVGVHGLCMWV